MAVYFGNSGKIYRQGPLFPLLTLTALPVAPLKLKVSVGNRVLNQM